MPFTKHRRFLQQTKYQKRANCGLRCHSQRSCPCQKHENRFLLTQKPQCHKHGRLAAAKRYLTQNRSSNLSRRRLLEINHTRGDTCRRFERINRAGVKCFFQTFERVWDGRYVPAQQSDSLRSQPSQSLRDTILHDF